MYVIEKPPVEPRLQKRYWILVEQHISTCESLATGVRVRLTKSSKKAAAKGASRFYDNDAVSLSDLGAPLIERGHQAVKEHCQSYVLCVHDVSALHYTNHPSKSDRRVMYSRDDLGYELQIALLVSDSDGAPLALICLNLAAAEGVHSTRRETLLPERPWIDELNRTMGYIEQQQFDLPLVHIVEKSKSVRSCLNFINLDSIRPRNASSHYSITHRRPALSLLMMSSGRSEKN